MMRSSSALANSTAGPSPSTSTWRSSCGCGCRSCLLSREGLLRVVALFSAFSLSHSLRPSVNQYFSSLLPPPASHPPFFLPSRTVIEISAAPVFLGASAANQNLAVKLCLHGLLCHPPRPDQKLSASPFVDPSVRSFVTVIVGVI